MTAWIFLDSYPVGVEQLQDGIMAGNLREVRYLGENYDDLEDEELMALLLSEGMVPEKIEVSEFEKQDGEVHYDVRIWDYDGVESLT
ncbi:MAG: hypothetical protein ABEJ07_02340 [Candidatus Nanohaloarchaea archaeon]